MGNTFSLYTFIAINSGTYTYHSHIQYQSNIYETSHTGPSISIDKRNLKALAE